MNPTVPESALALTFAFFSALLVVATILLAQIQRDIRLIRTLIAAFMEHKVAPTVAQNKLAAAVEQANKPAPFA